MAEAIYVYIGTVKVCEVTTTTVSKQFKKRDLNNSNRKYLLELFE